MLIRGNKNFRAPGENRIRDLPHARSDVLTTEPPGLYRQWSRNSTIPAECTTLPYFCNFRAPGEHSFSFFQVKMFTGSVSVLLTSTSLKITKCKIINFCNFSSPLSFF